MSEYTERYVRIGNEATWGTYCPAASFDVIEYCLSFDGTTAEERIEEDLIASSRQAMSRVWSKRTVTGSFEKNVQSPRMLHYALGDVTNDATSPYAISLVGDLTLPSFSIERGLRGDSDTIWTGYMGCKVDRYELVVEAEQDITETVDFVAMNTTFPTYTSWSTIDTGTTYTSEPFNYTEACLIWGGDTIKLRRVRIEINNNLEPRYAGMCTSGDPYPFEIREGAQRVTGDFVVGESVNVYASSYALNRTEGSLVVKIGNYVRGTMVITLGECALDEFADSLRGRDVYEVTFPFTANSTGPAAYDAITVVYNNTVKGTIYDLPP